MNIQVDLNNITVNNKTLSFKAEIKCYEVFGDILIIITKSTDSELNENVWGVNSKAEVIWQIEKLDKVEYNNEIYSGISSPYIEVVKIDEITARLFNWDGCYYEVNPTTGSFLKNILEYRLDRRPW